MAKKATTSKGATASKSTASKGKTSANGAPRRANTALMRPVSVSPDLQAIVGGNSMPRTEVTKKVWDYIKSNKLQDAKERRNINADAKLQKVFGGKKTVNMFEMTKLINQHLS